MQIDDLYNGQIVNVETVFNKKYEAIVHMGNFKTKSGTYFYLMPIGDSHPGAAITRNEILSTTPLNK